MTRATLENESQIQARRSLRIVLVETRNPLNIGAAARAIANFGFEDLRLVRPYDEAWREARSAVHAANVLQNARVYESLSEAVADCTLVVGTTAVGHRHLQHTLRPLESAGPALRRRLLSAPAALLFGSEKFGLSNEDLSFCHWLLRIGTVGEHASMNLGQAVAVCLYELTRRPAAEGAKPAAKREVASSEQLERLTTLLAGLLDQSGYPRTQTSEIRLRRLVRHLRLGPRDADVLAGMLRQIRWKLDEKGR